MRKRANGNLMGLNSPEIKPMINKHILRRFYETLDPQTSGNYPWLTPPPLSIVLHP